MVGRYCLLFVAETPMGKPGQKQISGSAPKSALNAVKSRPEKSQKFKNSDQKYRNTDEASTNPQTCCSHCQTVFEISRELLSTSDTRVRCGECLGVFDALANFCVMADDSDNRLSQARSDDIQSDGGAMVKVGQPKAGQLDSDASNPLNANAAVLAGLANDTASLDETYSDFDLFSSDAGLPYIQFFDNTRGMRDFHFDDVSDTDDETFSDTLFRQDVTMDARSILLNHASSPNSSSIALGGDVGIIAAESYSEPLIFNYRDTKAAAEVDTFVDTFVETPISLQSPELGHLSDSFDDELPFGEAVESTVMRSPKDHLRVPEAVSSRWFLRGGLFAIVLATVASLYGYRERDALLNNVFLRPILSSTCELLFCQLPEQVDLDALRAVDRSVVKHPTVANALIIKFGIVNQASFSQPHPILEIRLTDRTGRLVVKNKFLPSEYLRDWQQGDVLGSGERLDIGLAVEDPGNIAISFELAFREVK
ncbi:MAG: putative Zn finger-like uncharacterized protein [Granulosicoccus sp.]|jgi:predicted Zn finger-like uncharacterized protein